jgi:ABC-type transport system substrate-binding protein
MSKFSAAVVGLMAAVVLAAPASAENVLRWASVGGALTADPHAYSESPTNAQLTQVYDVLIGLDSNLELAPRLATSWRRGWRRAGGWLIRRPGSSSCARTSGFTMARHSAPRTWHSALRAPELSFRQVSQIAPKASPTCRSSMSTPYAS